jgi:hypothetical protein
MYVSVYILYYLSSQCNRKLGKCSPSPERNNLDTSKRTNVITETATVEMWETQWTRWLQSESMHIYIIFIMQQ